VPHTAQLSIFYNNAVMKKLNKWEGNEIFVDVAVSNFCIFLELSPQNEPIR
jgi:hypothetical protein